MVDFYGLFILVIAISLEDIRNLTIRYVFWGLSVIFLMLNIFQTYQMAVGIMHPDSMNYKAYKHIFLKAGHTYEDAVAADSEYHYGDLEEEIYMNIFDGLEGDKSNKCLSMLKSIYGLVQATR